MVKLQLYVSLTSLHPYNNLKKMNPETKETMTEGFVQEILTVYNKYTEANEELTNKFNEDISAIINKLFETLKSFEEENETIEGVMQGVQFVTQYIGEVGENLSSILGRDEDDGHQK